ncbi:MAG: CTP synthase [Chlamydiales bacterium]
MRKYIFITGGVVSSLGKGLTLASIAMLLEKKGLQIAMLKLDPYLNVDPGTMNPFEHGEVYVTDDGTEADLDLGHYYRYTNALLSRDSTATTGQIYDTVIKQERQGDYLGRTVQVIPHITEEIKKRIKNCGQVAGAQVVLIEIGGTVGDIESLPFLEAIRQFRYDYQNDCLNIHMTYVPYLKAAGEVKTKPTQHSVQTLRGIGILPDLILCRCENPLSSEIKEKISLFCNIPYGAVFDEVDVKNTIYEVPIMLHKQGVTEIICRKLNLESPKIDLCDWEKIIKKVKKTKETLTVGIVGKYLQHQDAYKSLFEALHHAAIAVEYNLKIQTIEADRITEFEGCDGYLVPGGFGPRGWEGKILAAKYCREKNIPFFGICFGMQVLVVEFARHVLGLIEANSVEIDPLTKDPIISLLNEQKTKDHLGGTMRLGSYPCSLKEGSKTYQAYGEKKIFERHRHRYEFNNQYKNLAEKHGLLVSGIFEKENLCEAVEIQNHPWMIGVQFHPEFKSRPTKPHPLFLDFMKSMIKYHEKTHSKH